MSRAIMDMRAEGELNKFLDEYFYSELLQGIKCKDIERITDKETQKKGVDVVISNVKNDKYYIDEKAQLYYINESLPTFAFEIDYINRYKEVAEGWLLNDKLMTDYYCLIWPNATHNNLKEIKSEDFTKVECFLISKKNILDYLNKNGWNKRRILEKSKEIRKNNSRGKVKLDKQNKFYFYFSEQKNYYEEPINIVIIKSELEKIAKTRYVVTKDYVIKNGQTMNSVR